MYRTQKPFRTRLYAWLPPEGPGAERLMRGYRPCDRRSGTKFDTNSIFSKNIAPFIDRGGYLCYNKSVKNSPIRSVFGWYGTDKVYSHRARFVVHDGESVNICSARRRAQGAAGAVFISNYIRVSRLNTSLVLVCFGIYAGIY